jgi:hypothetical protein
MWRNRSISARDQGCCATVARRRGLSRRDNIPAAFFFSGGVGIE